MDKDQEEFGPEIDIEFCDLSNTNNQSGLNLKAEEVLKTDEP